MIKLLFRLLRQGWGLASPKKSVFQLFPTKKQALYNFSQCFSIFPKPVFQETVALSPSCQFQLPEDSPTTRFCKWAQHVVDDIGGQLEKLDTMVNEKEGDKKEEDTVIRQAMALTECARPLSPRCLDRLLSGEALDKNADEDNSGNTAPGFAKDASPNVSEAPAPAPVIEIEEADPLVVENALKTPDRKKESPKSPEANHDASEPEEALQSKPARGKRAPLASRDASKGKKPGRGSKNKEVQVEPEQKGEQKKPPKAKAKAKGKAKAAAKKTDSARGAGVKKVEKTKLKKRAEKKEIPETKESNKDDGKEQSEPKEKAEPEELLKKKLHSVPWHLERCFV